MKRRFVVVVALFSVPIVVQSQPHIYLVRHAETIANWPQGKISDYRPLNAAGLETANRLATYFAQKPVKTVYSSSTTRSLHTAFVIMQQTGAQIEVTDACADTSGIDQFLRKLKQEFTQADAVVIVSHSNIIPYFLIRAGLAFNRYEEMGFSKYQGWLLADSYGDIFVIDSLSLDKTKNSHIRKITAPELAVSQPSLTQSQFSIDSAQLQPGSYTLRMSIQDDSVGTAKYDLHLANDIWTLTEYTRISKYQVDATIVSTLDARTFQQKACSIKGLFFGQEADVDVTWEGNQAVGYSQFPRGPEEPQGKIPIEMMLPSQTIERTAAFFLLPAMPIEERSEFSFQWFNTYNGKLEDIKIQIGAIEAVTVPAGKFRAFRMRIHQQPQVIAYISVETPRRVLKMDLIGQPWKYALLPD